jgi:hypothetical protein
MIANVVDRRRRPYRWQKVNAIVEATWHDNSVADSDQASRAASEDDKVDYDQLEDVPLSEAIAWTQGMPGQVTLYLYDFGDGIAPAA